jgi:hypothetical protein
MAKRLTIRSNPLDTLMPNPKPDKTGKSPAAADARSTVPAAESAQTSSSRSRPRVRDSTEPTSAMQVAQPPASTDIISRVESLEKQNVYITWLVGAGILLVLLL